MRKFLEIMTTGLAITTMLSVPAIARPVVIISKIGKVLIGSIGLLGLFSSSAQAACLKYGEVVSLFMDENNKRVTFEDGQTAKATASQVSHFERLLVLTEQGTINGSNVNYGDKIVLRTNQDRYVVAEPSGEIKSDRTAIGPWEKFTLHQYTGAPSTNCVNLVAMSSNGYVAIETSHGKFLSAEPNGELKALATVPDPSPVGNGSSNTTLVVLLKDEWTNFYYKTPIETGSTPEPCPHMGRYDGANCFVAKDFFGSGFKYQGNLYYAGSNCPIGGWDTANCMVTDVPNSANAFIHDNAFYIGKNTGSSTPQCWGSKYTASPGVHWNTLTGKHRARNNWRSEVQSQYSTNQIDWHKWSRAEDKGSPCVSTGSFMNWEYTCTSSARPCPKMK